MESSPSGSRDADDPDFEVDGEQVESDEMTFENVVLCSDHDGLDPRTIALNELQERLTGVGDRLLMACPDV